MLYNEEYNQNLGAIMQKNRFNIYFKIKIILLILFLVSCSGTMTQFIRYWKPSKKVLPSNIQKVAFLGFSKWNGPIFQRALNDISETLGIQARFRIIDSSDLSDMLEENKWYANRDFNTNSIIKSAKTVGLDAVVFGHFPHASVKESTGSVVIQQSITRRKKRTEGKGKKKRTIIDVTYHTREYTVSSEIREYKVSSKIYFIDVDKGKILFQQKKVFKKTYVKYNTSPSLLDAISGYNSSTDTLGSSTAKYTVKNRVNKFPIFDKVLLEVCRALIFKFSHDIAPYYVSRKIRFQKGGDKINKHFMRLIKDGDMTGAYEYLTGKLKKTGLIKSRKNCAKIYYNYALVSELKNKLKQSLTYIKKANRLRSSKMYRKVLKHLQRRVYDLPRIQKQLKKAVRN